jgi:hypothetical protein
VKRKIPTEIGEQALMNPASDPATAVRYCLQLIEQQVPGHSVELRIPPYGAIQCIEGLNHRRGTPPNVVEMNPEVFLSLSLGKSTWQQEIENGKVLSSGGKSTELESLFPLRRD